MNAQTEVVLTYMRERIEADEEIAMDANSASLVLAELGRAEAEQDRLREVNRNLHRRVQASESKLAQATPERVEKLEVELAAAKVERHKFSHENAFMKSERKRLKAALAAYEVSA